MTNAFPAECVLLTLGQIKTAFLELGFTDVVEVAIGADLCTIEEAKDFTNEVPDKQPFMATSCCPAWSVMAKKLFPDFAPYISMALTPMVLTFEEFASILEARDIDITKCEESEFTGEASGDGIGFAVSGGVAAAVEDAIKVLNPGREIKTARAEGLQNCKKMLQIAKTGKYNGYLLEGMACPGGCVAGAGTIVPVRKSTEAVNKLKGNANMRFGVSSKYRKYLSALEK